MRRVPSSHLNEREVSGYCQNCLYEYSAIREGLRLVRVLITSADWYPITGFDSSESVLSPAFFPPPRAAELSIL